MASPSLHTYLRRLAFGLALAAVAFSYLGKRFGLLDYRPGGANFDNQIQPVFIVLFIAATVLAIKFEWLGGLMAGFGAAVLVAFAVNQLELTHALAVLASFAVPAGLFLFVDLGNLGPKNSRWAMAAAVVVVVVGYFAGQALYERSWGPTHPASAIAPLPESQIGWVWSGAVTTTEAEVKAKPNHAFGSARLAVSLDSGLSDPRFFEAIDTSGNVIGFELDGLEPDTEYWYAVELDGLLDEVRVGQLQTYPEGAASFSFAVGACARVGSNGQVFETIRELDPLFYMIAGDLHYGDNGRDDAERYREVMDLTLSMPAQAALYLETPVAYMWDDHDYGGNDSDGTSPSRNAAMANYREYVPSYELSGDESAVYQAFTVGRVRFLLTDARSARDLDRETQDGVGSILGTEQKEWLKNELAKSAKDHALVVWLNPVPWVAEEQLLGDNWGGYPEERAELANHITDNRIDNLLMISGDAHMVAIDDGTNTDYSTEQRGGFPLFHAAALDRNGSIKGGPYTEGAVDGPGQFGMVEVIDDGDAIQVTLTGMDWTGEELMSYTFAPGSTRN